MKKYTYLTQEERTWISHYHDNGISIGEIGRRLGRNKSSISRELSRNSNKDGNKGRSAFFFKTFEPLGRGLHQI